VRINGKSILVRYAWTDMTTTSPHFEQSFSDDGGKTWEVNWITDQTRVTDYVSGNSALSLKKKGEWRRFRVSPFD